MRKISFSIESLDMLFQVKNVFSSSITFAHFLVYTNHRPVFGLQAEKIIRAFELLGFETEAGMAIERGDLLDLLQNKGSHVFLS